MFNIFSLTSRKLKKAQKALTWFAIFSLILQLNSGIFLTRQVFAEEPADPMESSETSEPTDFDSSAGTDETGNVGEPTELESTDLAGTDETADFDSSAGTDETGNVGEPTELENQTETSDQTESTDSAKQTSDLSGGFDSDNNQTDQLVENEENKSSSEEEVDKEPKNDVDESEVAEESAEPRHTTLEVIKLEGEEATGGTPNNTWTPGNVTEYKEGDVIRFRVELVVDPSETGTFDTLFTHEDHSSSLGTCTFFNAELASYELTGPSFSGSPPTGLTVTPSAVTIVSSTGGSEGKITWTISTDGTIAPDTNSGLIFSLRLSDVAGACDGSSQHVHNENDTGDANLQQTQNVNVPANKLIVLGSITVNKYIVGSQILLPGAIFALCPSGIIPPDPTSCVVVTDGVSPDPLADGIVIFDGLETSSQGIDYDIYETAAPVGYTPDPSSPRTVSLTKSDPDQTVNFYNSLATGTVVVHKDVQGPNGEDIVDTSENFTVRLDGIDPQLLTDNGIATYSGVTAGSHAVTEDTPPSGYTLYSILPDDDGGTPGAQITVIPGQTTDVYVINRQENATITVVKDVVDPDGSDVADSHQFTVHVDGSSDNIGEGDNGIFVVLPGTYTVTEDSDPDYDLVSISPDDDGQTPGTQVIVGPGEQKTVTVVNKQKKATINVEKDVVDPDELDVSDNHAFTAQLNGGNNQSFSESSPTSYLVNPGTHTITELDDPDYDELGCQLPTGVLATDFSLDSNETITVTCQNKQKPAQVTIIKDVRDPYGNDVADTAEFTVKRDGGDAKTFFEGSNAVYNLNPGEYVFTEDGKAGYTLNSIDPDNDADPANGTTQVLSSNQNLSITFINYQDLGSISGHKYEDLDGNLGTTGDQTGVLNWGIVLYRCLSDFTSCTFVTDYFTGIDGVFNLNSLIPGFYKIVEIVKAGWTSLTPEFIELEVGPGEQIADQNFVNFEEVSVKACKEIDADGKISTTGDRTPYQGWEVKLLVDGIVDDAETTDETGCYTWDNLGPGHTYGVAETVSSGWTALSPTSYDFGTAESGSDYVYTFVNFECSKIWGYKWEDSNGDGIWDGGESPINGWEIGLTKLPTFMGAPADEIVETGAGEWSDGYYEFEVCQAGFYRVNEALENGWTNTHPSQAGGYLLQATSGNINPEPEGDFGWDFGNFEQGSILACKYEDLDGDGELDEGEPGIEGVTMTLEKYVCGLLDGVFRDSICDWTWQEVGSGDTGEDGCYEFNGLDKGDYRVSETVPDGYYNTSPTMSDPISLNSGDNETVNFLNAKYSEITVCKYEDLNGDGKLDEGEPGVEGVEIQINKEDSNGLTQISERPEYLTGEDGCYTFENLPFGTYFISEVVPDGFYQTFPLDPDYHEVSIGSGVTVMVYFLNAREGFELSLEKTSDKIGVTASPGDTVTFTLIVSNAGPGTAYDVVVKDVLPDGFTYLSGTAKVNGVGSEPTVSGQTLKWNVGNLGSGDSTEITYQVETDSGLPAGEYPDVAVASGNDKRSGSEDISTSYSNFAYVYTALGVGVSYSTSVGGLVLGAATEAGQVLGAATGSPTMFLIIALLMILMGIAFLNFSRLKKLLARLNTRKLFRSFLIALGLLIFAVGVARAADSLIVKIGKLPDYINQSSLNVYYTALQVEGKPVTVKGYMNKEGQAKFEFGSSNQTSGSFPVDGSLLSGDGKYYFLVKATSDGVTVQSDEESVIIDRQAPGPVSDYRKEKISSLKYKLCWKNPDEDDFKEVLIYRSDKTEFTADSSTQIAGVGGTKNEEKCWENDVPDDKNYYYVTRVIDQAGNISGVIGDSEVTTTTTEQVAGAETGVSPTPISLPVVSPAPSAEGEAEEGQILGGEAAETMPETGGLIGGLGQTTGETISRLGTWKTIGLIVVIGGLIGLGVYFFRKR